MNFLKKLILVGLMSGVFLQNAEGAPSCKLSPNKRFLTQEERSTLSREDRLLLARLRADMRQEDRVYVREQAKNYDTCFLMIPAVIVGVCVCMMLRSSTAHVPGVENRTNS